MKFMLEISIAHSEKNPTHQFWRFLRVEIYIFHKKSKKREKIDKSAKKFSKKYKVMF